MGQYILFELTITFSVIVALLLFVSYRIDKRSFIQKTNVYKKKQYSCGEKEMIDDVPASGFYGSIIETLKFYNIKKLHSGKLTDYLSWIFTGLIIIILILLIVMR